VAALEGLAREFGERADLDCQFETDLDDLELDPHTAIALYRVAQESLTNVARHAQATEVQLSLAATADQVMLCVTDNGQGFDPATAAEAHSLGLAGMRERMHALGGELEIISASGQGTTVKVKVPKCSRR